jgi:homoserine kinase
LIMSFPSRATAYAPGSIGNLGPGLDVLGCAVEGAGDTVTAEFADTPGITVLEPGHPSLSTDPAAHASAIAAHAVVRRATHMGATTPAGGIALRVTKGLPLSAGQGGSAASAVAGAAAVNALIGSPLARDELLDAALFSETQLAGRHLDNIAPSYLGGIVLVRSLDPIDVLPLPVPDALPVEVSLNVALHQAAQVAGIVAALHSGDLAFLGRCIDDRIAEPARSALLPGFTRAKQAAMSAGALGVSISGAGPTSFALCGGASEASKVAEAMADAYRKSGVDCTTRVARPDLTGTRIETSTRA